MKKLSLGLDVGISSVGWSVVDLENGELVDLGVRLFEEGTASENVKRRSARSGRRLKRRRTVRLHDAKKLLIDIGFEEKDLITVGNPYDFRCKGLNEKLTKQEFSTAYLHLVKRRGSSHESIEEDQKENDEQSTKLAMQINDRLISDGKYPCEIQRDRLLENGKIRQHSNNFRTSHYVLELTQILKNQEFSDETNTKLIELIKRRRMYYDGPGSLKSPTQYGKYILQDNGEIKVIDLLDKMRGHCSVFTEELRAPKLSPTAELFNFLNDLNNLSYSNGEKISEMSKREILEKYILNGKHKVTPNQLAKELGIGLEELEGFRIDKSNKKLMTEFKGLNLLINSIESPDVVSNFDILDQISDILTKTKGVEERQKSIISLNHQMISTSDAIRLSQLKGFSQYHSLSLKAIMEMIEDLIKTSDNQMQILSRKHLTQNRFKEFKGLAKIPVDNEAILSPVARRSQNETIKVVNAARKRYGEFATIVVEMPRDKNSDEQVKRIREEQKRFEDNNKRYQDIANGQKTNSKIRQKIRLYEEQDGKCLYTGEPLDLNLILNDSTAYEIDHILPVSISFDDSMQNTALVLNRANQEKGNLTPIMAFNQHRFSNGWSKEVYQSFIQTSLRNRRISYKKAHYLLFEDDITKFEMVKEFINRNLVDTRYASRVVLNTLQDYFKANNISTKIITVKGAVTGAFRKKIDLKKDREESHYHHAVDASLVALIAKQDYLGTVLSNITLVNDLLSFQENTTLEILDENAYFDQKYLKILSKLKNVEAVKLSYKVDRKPNRQISDETIYSTRSINNEVKVVKKYKDIYDPKFTKLAEKILNGKEEDLLVYHHDSKTFEKLKIIVDDYIKYVGPVDKENPFEWYRKDHGKITKYAKNNNGPVIDSIKYYDGVLGNHIDISKKYIQNENIEKVKKVVLLQISPYRTDFYKNSDGIIKFVTIRYCNLRFVSTHQKYLIETEWYENEKVKKGIELNALFLFSLNRNEIIELTSFEKKTNETLIERWRFIATGNDATNVILVNPIDHYEKQISITIGRKTVQLRKISVDVLGNCYENKNEGLKLNVG